MSLNPKHFLPEALLRASITFSFSLLCELRVIFCAYVCEIDPRNLGRLVLAARRLTAVPGVVPGAIWETQAQKSPRIHAHATHSSLSESVVELMCTLTFEQGEVQLIE